MDQRLLPLTFRGRASGLEDPGDRGTGNLMEEDMYTRRISSGILGGLEGGAVFGAMMGTIW